MTMRLHAARIPISHSRRAATRSSVAADDPRARPRRRADLAARPRAGPDRGRLHLRRRRPRPPRSPSSWARSGTLIAIDRDPAAAARFAEFAAEAPCRTRFIGADFAEGLRALRGEGMRPDMVYMDLGMSSMQVDAWERGFSYSYDAPLDMRMDTRQEFDAADLVNEWPEARIAQVLRRFGEERYAGGIAREIVRRRPLQHDLRAGRRDQGRDAGRGPLRRRPPGQAQLPGDPDRRQRRARLARAGAAAGLGDARRSAAASARSPSTRSRTGRSSSSSPPRRAAASARRSCRSASAATSPRPSC